MFKRDKKDTLGLDATHSTQQFDAPSQNRPPPPKLQQPQSSMERAPPHSSSSAADKSVSIVTRPVQTTASTISTIVTMGGMLGGSKDESVSDVRQEAAESGEVPPAGVLRHEVTCSLLGVVATQPAARAARELCREVRVSHGGPVCLLCSEGGREKAQLYTLVLRVSWFVCLPMHSYTRDKAGEGHRQAALCCRDQFAGAHAFTMQTP
eukprot:scaffold43015_cov15-Tisochrysis_lutea.AAC.1